MDVQDTFSQTLIHMSLSEVCSANPLKFQSTEAEQTSRCVLQFPPRSFTVQSISGGGARPSDFTAMCDVVFSIA